MGKLNLRYRLIPSESRELLCLNEEIHREAQSSSPVYMGERQVRYRFARKKVQHLSAVSWSSWFAQTDGLFADFYSKALRGKLPNLECSRWLV